MSLTRNIARDSIWVTLLVIFGRSAGLLVPLFIARWFGADDATDAFYLVVGIPLFFLSLLQTALLSALNPLLARLKVERPEEVPTFLGSTLLVVAAGLTVLSLGLAAAVPPLIHLLTNDRPELAATAVALLYPLLPVIPIAALGIVLRSVLEVARAFRVAALLPLIKGVVYLLLAGLLRERLGIHALPVAYVLAELAQLAGFALAVRHLGERVGWTLAIPASLRQALALILPLMLGEAAVNLNVVIDKLFAARLGPGELTALEYADRVRVIPETALSAGLLSVVFAWWANHAATGSWLEVRQSFDRIARWLTLLLAPALVALWLLRVEVVTVLFQGGAFDLPDTHRTAAVLEGFLPGFLPMMLAVLAVKYLLVKGEVGVVVRAGLISTASNILLDALLVRPLGAPGLSLATSLNQIFIAGLLYRAMALRTGPVLEPGFLHWAALPVGVSLGLGGLVQYGLASLEAGFLVRCGVVAVVLGGAGAVMALTAWPARRA